MTHVVAVKATDSFSFNRPRRWLKALFLMLAAVGLALTVSPPAQAATTHSTRVTVQVTSVATRFDANGNKLAVIRHTTTARSGQASQADPVLQPADGCCSAAGGWHVDYYISVYGYAGNLLFRFHSVLIFCWGGGVAGVHWGYVFNCDNGPPPSAVYPINYAYYTNINEYFVGQVGLDPSSTYYYGWANTGYSYHSAFYDFQQGNASGCIAHYGCYNNVHPHITYWAHLNGEYDAAWAV